MAPVTRDRVFQVRYPGFAPSHAHHIHQRSCCAQLVSLCAWLQFDTRTASLRSVHIVLCAAFAQQVRRGQLVTSSRADQTTARKLHSVRRYSICDASLNVIRDTISAKNTQPTRLPKGTARTRTMSFVLSPICAYFAVNIFVARIRRWTASDAPAAVSDPSSAPAAAPDPPRPTPRTYGTYISVDSAISPRPHAVVMAFVLTRCCHMTTFTLASLLFAVAGRSTPIRHAVASLTSCRVSSTRVIW